MSAETTAAQAPGAPVVCSRAGCRAEARWQVVWRNPRIHEASRRKIWTACDAHVAYLRDYLAALSPCMPCSSCGQNHNSFSVAERPAGTKTAPSWRRVLVFPVRLKTAGPGQPTSLGEWTRPRLRRSFPSPMWNC